MKKYCIVYPTLIINFATSDKIYSRLGLIFWGIQMQNLNFIL